MKNARLGVGLVPLLLAACGPSEARPVHAIMTSTGGLVVLASPDGEARLESDAAEVQRWRTPSRFAQRVDEPFEDLDVGILGVAGSRSRDLRVTYGPFDFSASFRGARSFDAGWGGGPTSGSVQADGASPRGGSVFVDGAGTASCDLRILCDWTDEVCRQSGQQGCVDDLSTCRRSLQSFATLQDDLLEAYLCAGADFMRCGTDYLRRGGAYRDLIQTPYPACGPEIERFLDEARRFVGSD